MSVIQNAAATNNAYNRHADVFDLPDSQPRRAGTDQYTENSSPFASGRLEKNTPSIFERAQTSLTQYGSRALAYVKAHESGFITAAEIGLMCCGIGYFAWAKNLWALRGLAAITLALAACGQDGFRTQPYCLDGGIPCPDFAIPPDLSTCFAKYISDFPITCNVSGGGGFPPQPREVHIVYRVDVPDPNVFSKMELDITSGSCDDTKNDLGNPPFQTSFPIEKKELITYKDHPNSISDFISINEAAQNALAYGGKLCARLHFSTKDCTDTVEERTLSCFPPLFNNKDMK